MGFNKLDIFPKFDSQFESEARDKTIFGAALSVSSIIFIVFLIVAEFTLFFSTTTKHELFVDTSEVGQRMKINFNITFHHTPCDLISVDAIDSFGEFNNDVEKTSHKTRVTDGVITDEKVEELKNAPKINDKKDDKKDDKECQSCYGAEHHPGECCNTCAELRKAYEARGWTVDETDISIKQCAKERLRRSLALANREGCNLAGTLDVKRVQGNLHFIPGRSFTHFGSHMHDLTGSDVGKLNLAHTVNELGFGETYPGQRNPLDGKHRSEDEHLGKGADAEDVDELAQTATKTSDGAHHGALHSNPQAEGQHHTHPFGGGRFQYYVKVVPTWYERLYGGSVKTNQYSVTEHFTTETNAQNAVPGLFFIYDISPIMVHVWEARPYDSIVHFILEMCAIAGGVFTVAGLVDSFCYHGSRKVRQKMLLGKQG